VLRCRGPASSSRHACIYRAFEDWSGREDNGSADVAAGCLGECLGGVGEAVAGGDRNLKSPSTSTLWGVPLIFNVKAMAASRWLGLIGRSRPTWTAPAGCCINGRVLLTDERG
jgi:hypothetical protein